MSLHDEIMNLPAQPDIRRTDREALIYKEGHRHARHAAAELALKADARIAGLGTLEKDAQRYRKWRAAYTNPNGRRHAIDTMLAAVASAWTPEQVDAAIDGVCAALEQKP